MCNSVLVAVIIYSSSHYYYHSCRYYYTCMSREVRDVFWQCTSINTIYYIYIYIMIVIRTMQCTYLLFIERKNVSRSLTIIWHTFVLERQWKCGRKPYKRKRGKKVLNGLWWINPKGETNIGRAWRPSFPFSLLRKIGREMFWLARNGSQTNMGSQCAILGLLIWYIFDSFEYVLLWYDDNNL